MELVSSSSLDYCMIERKYFVRSLFFRRRLLWSFYAITMRRCSCENTNFKKLNKIYIGPYRYLKSCTNCYIRQAVFEKCGSKFWSRVIHRYAPKYAKSFDVYHKYQISSKFSMKREDVHTDLHKIRTVRWTLWKNRIRIVWRFSPGRWAL